MDENDLTKRLFRFAVDVLKLLKNLKGGTEIQIINYQLGKAASSSGANYEEAQGAVSKADFAFKVGISAKEMRESNYWLRILNEILPANNEFIRLTNESSEIKKILFAINRKVSPRT